MSDINTHDTTNNSAENGTGASKAVWDDKAVADMYFTLAEMRGGLHSEEARQLEERMRAKGYGFTSTQFVNKHNNLRKRLGSDKTAASATAEAKPKANGKTPTPRKARSKAPTVDADGNVVGGNSRAKPSTKKEVESAGNAGETEGPPTKKRKASGSKTVKKVIEIVTDVKSVKGEVETESDSSRSADIFDGAADALGNTIVAEKYDASAGEGHEKQVQVVEATKVEMEKIACQTVVQTFA